MAKKGEKSQRMRLRPWEGDKENPKTLILDELKNRSDRGSGLGSHPLPHRLADYGRNYSGSREHGYL